MVLWRRKAIRFYLHSGFRHLKHLINDKAKKISIWLFSIILISILGMIICDQSVVYNAEERLYDNVDSIPHRKVGLILGTSPISTWNGRRNYYFDQRIKAGEELYKAGKVDWLVVSGGDYRNTENGYDEPVAMRDSLIKQGVDSARIVLDYDGTRTLNSIAKMRDVYCQDSIIIISQNIIMREPCIRQDISALTL